MDKDRDFNIQQVKREAERVKAIAEYVNELYEVIMVRQKQIAYHSSAATSDPIRKRLTYYYREKLVISLVCAGLGLVWLLYVYHAGFSGWWRVCVSITVTLALFSTSAVYYKWAAYFSEKAADMDREIKEDLRKRFDKDHQLDTSIGNIMRRNEIEKS